MIARSALLAAALPIMLGGCSVEPAEQSAASTEAAQVASQPTVSTLDAAMLADLVERGEVVLIDVRTPGEFATGRLPGAVNAPVETFDAARLPLDETRETILYCRSGKRSERAATMLAEARGIPVRHLEGGIQAWEANGGAIIPAPAE